MMHKGKTPSEVHEVSIGPPVLGVYRRGRHGGKGGWESSLPASSWQG